ncbi:MAG: hypothetical protein V1722_00545 [Candidatus Micrarchaeota archaeon]
MAKVVLVWNEHPTEVVAGFHARKVAQILREKYGHEVVVEKIPAAETNYGIARKIPTSRKKASTKVAIQAILQRLGQRDSTLKLTQKMALKHNAMAFNFHASGALALGEALIRRASAFRIGKLIASDELNSRTTSPYEIEFHQKPNKPYAISIEMPGMLFWLRGSVGKRNKQQIKKAQKELLDLQYNMHNPFGAGASLHADYQRNVMRLTSRAQRKYISPIISEKIAAAIHERITARRA